MSSSKEIEEKALNYFKSFLENSKSLSQFLTENDKEPCWDGSIYVYSTGHKNIKRYLIERIPTQVKGKICNISASCFYPIRIDDLKAYLHEPTLFVVCQIQKEGNERKLFYKFLLPETVKHIIKGKSSHNSVSVQLQPMPELDVFEKEALHFIGDKRKQSSFADKNTISIQNAISRGINTLSFVIPEKMDTVSLMRYMSSRFSFLYAKIDDELDIDVPILEGPAKFTFKEEIPLAVGVKDRVFYNSFCGKIEDGIYTISVGDLMTIVCPSKDGQNSMLVRFNSEADLLDERIKEYEFILAVLESGNISLGDHEFKINVNGNVDDLQDKIADLKNIKKLLTTLHVTKPLLLNTIKDEQLWIIGLLIDTILNKNHVKIPRQKSRLIKVEFGNLQLLVWCIVNKEGYCSFGDFFDGTCDCVCIKNIHDKTRVQATVYSLLSDKKLWEQIDNINFDQIVSKTKVLLGKHKYVFRIANQDVLSMIEAADNLMNKDANKTKVLLSKAKELTIWCQENDVKENIITYRLNTLQIIKRERLLNEEENVELMALSDSKSEAPINRLAACMLLEDREQYSKIRPLVDENEFETLKSTPIGKYLLGT